MPSGSWCSWGRCHASTPRQGRRRAARAGKLTGPGHRAASRPNGESAPPPSVELARAADGPLVELAVGNGRVAIPVTLATGRRIIGSDSSPAMLERARTRAAEAGVDLDLREGDLRDLALTEPAALVYCPFRALPTTPAR